MTTSRIRYFLLVTATLAGCSGGEATKPTKETPRPDAFESLQRVSTELRAAQELGMNRQRFKEHLIKFATELSLSKDKAKSPNEKEIIQGYTDALQIYKDAAAVWDLKVQIPQLVDLADKKADLDRSAGSVESTGEALVYSRATNAGIPLTLFTKESTGMEAIVARYKLPVTDSEGWKIIPTDSVQRIWTKATAKLEEVMKKQKG